jgi:hypothetical protein
MRFALGMSRRLLSFQRGDHGDHASLVNDAGLRD